MLGSLFFLGDDSMKFWMLLSWWLVGVNLFTMQITGGWNGWRSLAASVVTDVIVCGYYLILRRRVSWR